MRTKAGLAKQLKLLGLLAGLMTLTCGTALPAQPAQSPHETFEIDVSNTGNDFTYRSGEPEIAVNQRNEQNLILANAQVKHGPISFAPGFLNCSLSISADRGQTWKQSPLPITDSSFVDCGDGLAAAGPDGTLYAGGGSFAFVIDANLGLILNGHLAVIRSSDNGNTWSTPVDVYGTETQPELIARGYHPAPLTSLGSPFDRGWLVVDQSTGTLYISGSGHPQRYVVASHDQGRTWGTVYAVDSDKYPETGVADLVDGRIAAASGVLAVAYLASAAPGNACPCAVFETSTDDGATFDRHVVPFASGFATGNSPRRYVRRG